MHEHQWERGAHMAEAFGVDGRTYACAICGERRPVAMTDHGGAASPRTPRHIELADKIGRLLDDRWPLTGQIIDAIADSGLVWPEEAQEAPAPEGLDEVRLSQAFLRIHPDFDGWRASGEARNVARAYAALAPAAQEAPAPEGLREALDAFMDERMAEPHEMTPAEERLMKSARAKRLGGTDAHAARWRALTLELHLPPDATVADVMAARPPEGLDAPRTRPMNKERAHLHDDLVHFAGAYFCECGDGPFDRSSWDDHRMALLGELPITREESELLDRIDDPRTAESVRAALMTRLAALDPGSARLSTGGATKP